MKISDFVKPELEFISGLANFTKDEEQLFWLKAKEVPLEEIAEQMNISVCTAYRLHKKVKNKIMKVIKN